MWARGCIPACTGQGVCVSQHALGRGCIPAYTGQRGVCPGGSRGCLPTCLVGVYLGVSGQGGVCLGGVCPGCVSSQEGRHPLGPKSYTPLWTDRHLWKHNVRKLRLWAVIITRQHEMMTLGSNIDPLSVINSVFTVVESYT